MPYQPVPGARGVNMLPAGETDPNILETIQLKDGTTMVRTKKSGWIKALPYAIAAGMAAPHIAGLFAGAAGGAGGGAGSGAAGAAGGAGNMGLGGAAATTAAPSMPWTLAGVAGGGTGITLPPALAAAGGSAAAGGGASILDRAVAGLRDYGALGLAGYNAARSLSQGPTEAEKQLAEIMKLAQGRVQASEPLFNMLNTMAQAQMPKYTRGEE
jgi:hypothetical protein